MNAWNLDRFEAFLFDMDGVITDSMPTHCEAWRRVFESCGIVVTREEILMREGEKGLITLKTLLERNGSRPSPKDLNSLLDTKETIFRSLPRPEIFSGAEELVMALRGKGKKLALVTGTSLIEARDNVPPDLFRCFDGVVTGDQVHNGKPDPEPYVRALEKLGASRADSLVIENAPYGIQSAKGAGLRCIAVTTSLPAGELKGADKIVNDMNELCTLLFSGGAASE